MCRLPLCFAIVFVLTASTAGENQETREEPIEIDKTEMMQRLDGGAVAPEEAAVLGEGE